MDGWMDGWMDGLPRLASGTPVVGRADADQGTEQTLEAATRSVKCPLRRKEEKTEQKEKAEARRLDEARQGKARQGKGWAGLGCVTASPSSPPSTSPFWSAWGN